jgi:hypothetical protein
MPAPSQFTLLAVRYDNLEQMDKVAGVQAQVNDVTNIMKVLLVTTTLFQCPTNASHRITSTKCLKTTTSCRLASLADHIEPLATTSHSLLFLCNFYRM